MTSRTATRVDTRIALALLREGHAPEMADWLPEWPTCRSPLAADDDPALPPFVYAELVEEHSFDPLRFHDYAQEWSA